MKILALSSSRVADSGYLLQAIPLIRELLGAQRKRIAFVPFASVGSYDDYFQKVSVAFSRLPHIIELVTSKNCRQAINSCDAIMVGGGNTFKLLHNLYEEDLIHLLRNRIMDGIPYIGWSAGSNILGPSISTTNDMPIIQPPGFESLNIFPFHINPHYYNQAIEGFNGETRDQRIEEFLMMNNRSAVIGLPEGSALLCNGDTITFSGQTGYHFGLENGVMVKSALKDTALVWNFKKKVPAAKNGSD